MYITEAKIENIYETVKSNLNNTTFDEKATKKIIKVLYALGACYLNIIENYKL